MFDCEFENSILCLLFLETIFKNKENKKKSKMDYLPCCFLKLILKTSTPNNFCFVLENIKINLNHKQNGLKYSNLLFLTQHL